MEVSQIATIAGKEFRDRIRNRWVLAIALLFTVFALAVSAGILWWLRKLDASTQKLQSLGMMLIASGALGNVIDRIRHGNVVDFIAVHWGKAYFPAFNVADSCITIGAGLVLLDALLESRSAKGAGGDRP